MEVEGKELSTPVSLSQLPRYGLHRWPSSKAGNEEDQRRTQKMKKELILNESLFNITETFLNTLRGNNEFVFTKEKNYWEK